MLLVHDVAADNTTVIIDNQCTIATLADRGDNTLGHAMGIIGIGKFKEQLLLHVIGHNALVGY